MLHRVIAPLLILAGLLMMPLAVTAHWAQRTLLEPDRFSETIAPLSEDTAVKAAVRSELTTQLTSAVEERLPEALPDSVSDAIEERATSAIAAGVERYVNSESFGSVWLSLGSSLQRQAVALIDDQPDALEIRDGRLVLDTTEPLTAVQRQLVAEGVPLIGSIDVSRYGREVVLSDNPNLQRATDLLAVITPMAQWLWVLAVALLLAGVVLFRPRRVGAIIVGLGLAVGAALTWAVLALGTSYLADGAATPALGELTQAVADILTRNLISALTLVGAVGLVLAAAAWLSGRLGRAR